VALFPVGSLVSDIHTEIVCHNPGIKNSALRRAFYRFLLLLTRGSKGSLAG